MAKILLEKKNSKLNDFDRKVLLAYSDKNDDDKEVYTTEATIKKAIHKL